MLSKNNRVLALIAFMAACSFAIGGLVLEVTTAESAALDAARAQLADLRQMTNELAVAMGDEEAGVDDYVLTHDSSGLRRYGNAAATERRTVEAIRAASADFPRLRTVLDVLAAASLTWQNQVGAPALSAVASDDAPAIARFVAKAANDRVDITAGLTLMDGQLGAASDDYEIRKTSATTTMVVGVTIAFSFLLLAFIVALVAVRRFGHALELDARQASVLNRFTEVTSFANDDRQVAASNLAALGQLAMPDASVTHILNRSMDRAVPEASTGDAIAEILPMHAIERCAGVLRGTMYVADDLSDELVVHCPVYPAAVGTLACIPLISGESVGTVHLYWTRPGALPLAIRPNLSRITEHAALAIGNRRMLAALHGQANTDPRTGLANSRAFDLALEDALAGRSPAESMSVLMMDIDNFKVFNDRHGHPAGDEALRAFGAVLHSCMRDGDVAARYGGDEFAVLLRGVDTTVAGTIAERIRARTEATIIALAPGLTDRVTVSIGIADYPEHGTDRVTLLGTADEALYRAKSAGRNRVVDRSDPPGHDGAAARAPGPVATLGDAPIELAVPS